MPDLGKKHEKRSSSSVISFDLLKGLTLVTFKKLYLHLLYIYIYVLVMKRYQHCTLRCSHCFHQDVVTVTVYSLTLLLASLILNIQR